MGDSSPLPGSCRGCGYVLLGLNSHRCPECGRAFDPADPKTMRFGREPDLLGRVILRRIPWRLLLLLLVAATVAIFFVTRPQLGEVRQWELLPLDLPFYGWQALHDPSQLKTSTDYTYAAGLWTWMALLAFLLPWMFFAAIARRYYRIERPTVGRPLRRFLLVLLLLIISAECVLVGWPYRLGRHVAAEYIALSASADGRQPLALVRPTFPMGFASGNRAYQTQILRSVVLQAPEPQERIAGLAMAQVCTPRPLAQATVWEALQTEQDATVLEWEIRLLGIHRDRGFPKIVDSYLASNDSRLRLAALDAIAAIEDRTRRTDLLLGSSPKIPVTQHVNRVPLASGWFPRTVFAESTQRRIAELLSTAADETDREAAAFAFTAVQILPRPHFPDPPIHDAFSRVAEWGVWVDTGGLVSAHQIVEDIPAFVHRYGDSAAAIARTQNRGLFTVTKPVMHFYCDRPLAVSVDASIELGRVSYVFPKPDRFSVETEYSAIPVTQALAAFDDKSGAKMLDPTPEWNPRLFPDSGGAFAPAPVFGPPPPLQRIGVWWRRLVVLPQQQPWMRPPIVPGDPKFAWWSRLRDVPSAWVHNRGESERFLYYDGPSLATPAVRVKMADAARLWIDSPTKERRPTFADQFGRAFQTARDERSNERRGMFIQVVGGSARGEAVPIPVGEEPAKPATYTIGSGAQLDTEQLTATLRDWVIDAGLTAAEADGMIACWRDTFFRRPGRRFVMLMSANDYDWLCPLWIAPRPKTLVRVGLVWTELSPKGEP